MKFSERMLLLPEEALEAFCENYTADYLSYEQTRFKLPAGVVFIF